MTHRNADTEINPSRIAPGEIFMVPGGWTMEEARAWLDANDPTQHKSADQRIREAFDNLRQTLVNVFGAPRDVDEMTHALPFPERAMCVLDQLEDEAHDFAKLPADA